MNVVQQQKSQHLPSHSEGIVPSWYSNSLGLAATTILFDRTTLPREIKKDRKENFKCNSEIIVVAPHRPNLAFVNYDCLLVWKNSSVTIQTNITQQCT